MTDICTARKEALKRRSAAIKAIAHSSIPRPLKLFLGVFLQYAESPGNYEVVWASQTSLGQKCGYAISTKDHTCRQIKRHIKLLAELGAITVYNFGMKAAKGWFRSRYDTTPKLLSDRHNQNFYLINWSHEIWSGELNRDKRDMVQSVRNGAANHLNRDKRDPVEPGHRCPDRKFFFETASDEPVIQEQSSDQIPPTTQGGETPPQSGSNRQAVANQHPSESSLFESRFESVNSVDLKIEQEEVDRFFDSEEVLLSLDELEYLEVLGWERIGFAIGEPSQSTGVDLTIAEQEPPREVSPQPCSPQVTPRPSDNWRNKSSNVSGRQSPPEAHRGDWFRRIDGDLRKREEATQKKLSVLKEIYG